MRCRMYIQAYGVPSGGFPITCAASFRLFLFVAAVSLAAGCFHESSQQAVEDDESTLTPEQIVRQEFGELALRTSETEGVRGLALFYPPETTTSFPRVAMEALGRIQSIQEIMLYDTQVTEQDLMVTGDMPNVRKVTISESPIEGLRFMKNFPNIESLDARHVPVADTDLGELLALKSLRRLSIGSSRMTSKGWATIGQLTDLETLSTTGSVLVSREPGDIEAADQTEWLESLGGLSKLKVLECVNLNVSASGARAVGQMSSLQSFSALRTNVRPEAARNLGMCPRLKWVQLETNSPETVQSLLELPALERLTLVVWDVPEDVIALMARHRTLKSIGVLGRIKGSRESLADSISKSGMEFR